MALLCEHGASVVDDEPCEERGCPLATSEGLRAASLLHDAAPDLLAALEATMDGHDNGERLDTTQVAANRAAIAKAKGAQ